MFKDYLKKIAGATTQGDAREESYYQHLADLLQHFAQSDGRKHIHITILPKKTEAGNPDFRIWDGRQHITGYIEAKLPGKSLDEAENSEQLKRYRNTFPNLILTDFYEFRLFRNGALFSKTTIARPFIAKKLAVVPPLEKESECRELFSHFFGFTLPKTFTASSLATELAKRTRFLRDEVLFHELKEESKGKGDIFGFYEAFKRYLVAGLTEKHFADLYAQTVTYGLFAARTRAGEDFNRELAFKYIPGTIGILKDVFRFISLGDLPRQMEVVIDDISEVLQAADIGNILSQFYREGKGSDPIVHFYETFLTKYDPALRERRGVYYTPEPVVKYIVQSVHSLLKSRFGLNDGLANEGVKLLDPSGGTLTFPAEAIRLATEEYVSKYGAGGRHGWIRNHILKNFYAFELMMAPYAIGHLKMGFVFDELGYKMSEDERFQLYLTNTLEMEEIEQIAIPGLSSLSAESHQAGVIKKNRDILVIIGNPPYSGHSANKNEWTNTMLKTDLDGAQSYYKIDGQPLGEKNSKWLQDDYVKFLRFAQWKIHQSGHGIVGMITNHGYLDNPTFRGMRQSLMQTFDEIFIIDLHGNSLKKETSPDGSKDENVFDIRQGVAIVLFVRNQNRKTPRVYHIDRFGLREEKYNWLESQVFDEANYNSIAPVSPWYFFIHRKTDHIQKYLSWKRVDEIFPVNVAGIVTSRDGFVTGFTKAEIRNRIIQFRNLSVPDDIIIESYGLKDTREWKLSEARKSLSQDESWDHYYEEVLYRPFDLRQLYYTDKMVDWGRFDVMRNMIGKKNYGMALSRRVEGYKNWEHAFITEDIVTHHSVSIKEVNFIFPLYLYPEKRDKKSKSRVLVLFEPESAYESKEKIPNISHDFLDLLETQYRRSISAEQILYYVYGILYSKIYREKFAEFLRIDFPRIPFTSKVSLFEQIAKFGQELAETHLLKSSTLNQIVAKYQGFGDNDRIEKIIYDDQLGHVQINDGKFFEGVTPECWNYTIGGYQILKRYLKDRKDRKMDDPKHYCRIVTAIQKTIQLQNHLDGLFQVVEKTAFLVG